MRCSPKSLFSGHKAPAARGRRRTTVRLLVEGLEERSLLTVPAAPIPYVPDNVFKVGNYWIDVPASYDATHQTPTELFVWSHGCGGKSEGDIWNVVAKAGGPTYIVITVDGREGDCWDVNADTPLVLGAIADVKTHFNIDPQRVVLGGYSSGGDLSYRVAFTHSTEIAGVLAENTSPFRDTGLTADQALAAPFHFQVVHLAHTEDGEYPIDGVRAETGAVRAAGLPGDGWASLQLIERPGTHFDADVGDTGTVHDLQTFLLPHLADGWTSPAVAQPSAPAGVTARVGTAPVQVALTWNAVPAAASYNVYRGTASGAEGTRVNAGPIAGLSFTDTAVQSGTTYFYTVTAVNAAGESAMSAEVSATPQAPAGAPSAPTGLTAGVGNAPVQVALTWNAVPGAASYNLYRGTASGGEGTRVYGGPVAGLSFTDTAVQPGTTYFYTVTAVNAAGESAMSAEVSATPHAPAGAPPRSVFVTGADKGGGPNVVIFDATTHQQLASFFAYEASFTGGVRVAMGDVNGDGVPDIIAAPGPGRSPEVKVYSGVDFSQLFSFFAFPVGFTGGVWVAAGDTNKDGFADIICGADSGGGPNISVWSGKDQAQTLLFTFFAYDQGFTGGVRIASGDVNGDGFADIVCGAGPGGGPNITVFDGRDVHMIYSFFAYAPNFINGVYVAAGDVNSDGFADILVGAGAGGGPNVTVFSGKDASLLLTFFPYDAAFSGGVRVAGVVRNGKPVVLSVAGPGGGPDVRVFDVFGNTLDAFFAYDPKFTGGIYVAGVAS